MRAVLSVPSFHASLERVNSSQQIFERVCARKVHVLNDVIMIFQVTQTLLKFAICHLFLCEKCLCLCFFKQAEKYGQTGVKSHPLSVSI